MSKAEDIARARLANNGRNPANNNAGIRTGGDLHLCEMLLAEMDKMRAALREMNEALIEAQSALAEIRDARMPGQARAIAVRVLGLKRIEKALAAGVDA
jgi:hypothetical protein